MKRAIAFVGSIVIGLGLFSETGWTQGAQQTVSLAKVDVQTLTAGIMHRRLSVAAS